VVTVTLALPLARTAGFTAQVVFFAATGREQDRLTCEVKPFWAATVTTFVKVAVWPALMVWVVAPEEEMVKSGGPVTVKFTALEDVGVGTGLTTVSG
jgi:hypothetical protein